jgi:hypothetical protein
MRILKNFLIAMMLLALAGCGSISQGPVPGFENIAGFPEVLPRSTEQDLDNSIEAATVKRANNIRKWNQLAVRFEDYLATDTEKNEMDEQIEALVARYEYEWRELSAMQQYTLLRLYYDASRSPAFQWPYTEIGWEKFSVDGADQEYNDLEEERRLRAMPAAWIPRTAPVTDEEVSQWKAYYSLHRLDVRRFWLSMNLLLDYVKMPSPKIDVFATPEDFKALEPAAKAFKDYPGYNYFLFSQLHARPGEAPRSTKSEVLWQEAYVRWLPILLTRITFDRWDMRQVTKEDAIDTTIHRTDLSYFGMFKMGYGRLYHDVYKRGDNGNYVKKERAGSATAVLPFWIGGEGKLYTEKGEKAIDVKCSPWLFGNFKLDTQRIKYFGPYATLYYGDYDTREDKPYVHSLGYGVLWLSRADTEHRNVRHGPLWGIIGAGRSDNRPAIYFLWQGIPIGPEKSR